MIGRTPVTQTPFDRGLPAGGAGLVTPLQALLAEARDPAAPVLRRLRLIGAIGRHVDGLFQLRAAEVRAAQAGERGAVRREQLRSVVAEACALLAEEILPALRERGVACSSGRSRRPPSATPWRGSCAPTWPRC